MTSPESETMSPPPPPPPNANPSRRRPGDADGTLVLIELNPRAVIDHLDEDGHPIHMLTFGSVRELCPKCRSSHLKLVLRQSAVRVAHLFCADCTSCYDAHYQDGAPALTI